MRGFTLAEFLISIAILAVAVVALFNLAGSAAKMSSKTENLAIAGDVAEQQLNKAMAIVRADEPPGSRDRFWDNEHTATPFLEGSVEINRTEFQYRVFAETLVDASTGASLGQGATNSNRVKKVDVVVWWMTPDPDQQRQGYGKLSVAASRLVNEVVVEE